MKRRGLIKPDFDLIANQWRRLRPAGGFKVVYIDCPWLFLNRSEAGEVKNPLTHYPCMAIEDIQKLPLHLLMASDCAVFSWHTWPMMETWAPTIKGWGLEFAGLAWEWLKYNPETGKYAFGLGYGSRKNVEPCLLLTRGDPRMRPSKLEFFGTVEETGSRSVRDFIECWPGNAIREERREHSRKPEEARARIERMFDGPRIELFGRQRAPGWTSWGNDLDRFAVKT